MGVRQLDIKNHLIEKARLLGNTDQGLLDMCHKLIVQYGTDSKSIQAIADYTHLANSCIRRFVSLTETEQGRAFSPEADTCERILKFFGVELSCTQTRIAARYAPKIKEWTQKNDY